MKPLAERVRALGERLDCARIDERCRHMIHVNLPDWIECMASIRTELERLAGEMRSIEGCDTRSELETATFHWADQLAPRKDG